MNKYSAMAEFEIAQDKRPPGRFSDWPLAVKSILAFWLVYYLTVVARAFMSFDPATILVNRSFTLLVGVLLTGCIYFIFALFARNAGLRKRLTIGVLASLAAAVLQAGILLSADRFLEKPQDEMRVVTREGHQVVQTGNSIRVERGTQDPIVLTFPKIDKLERSHVVRIAADSAVTWFFFFAAWSAFYMAMLAQSQALGAQRRAAEAETAARLAQVRALRYQVNPHFLFNTLNSLSSLVMSSRPDEAESMILKLSTFFRTTLSQDPSADVTLAQEIELQRLYLDIERVRFPTRLKVEIDIPADLENARLPALVLQPVIENVIKYAVSPTREKVELRIVAREAGPGRFTIEVSNSASNRKLRGAAPAEGTGVGLANVCDRLQARFGKVAKCQFGPLEDGGYRVLMTLPLERPDGQPN